MCDSCHARAKILVVFPDGNELEFCGHHAAEYHDTIEQVNGSIVDQPTKD